jgi:cell pole-organizing protein PopZ
VTISDRAELDSALNTIDDVIARVTAAAERHAADSDESVTQDLYEVERALQAASRRLAVVVRRLGG